MGQAKKIMMEMEENPISGVSERLVSEHLFRNQLIRNHIQEIGYNGICSYSGNKGNVLPLKSIVRYLNEIILRYFGEPNNEGLGWDSRFDNDATGFHSEGGGYIVPDNRCYYYDIRQCLDKTGFIVENNDLAEDIIDALNFHTNLVEKDPYGLNDEEVRILDWNFIKEKSIKMARIGMSINDIISEEAARLDYLRGDIHNAHYPLQVEKNLTLYRTVNYNTELNPVHFSNLTSPPIEYTKDMRMSIKGDSVFYGAEDRETTLEEAIKEKDDSYAYIGRFETRHPLFLLDLTRISDNLTIYDHEYEQFYLLSFLSKFCNAVSSRISDKDTTMYAPTQVITRYFRKNLRHYKSDGTNYPIDGILYTSSKNGKINAVLFFDNENSAKHLELKCWELIHDGKIIKHIVGK